MDEEDTAAEVVPLAAGAGFGQTAALMGIAPPPVPPLALPPVPDTPPALNDVINLGSDAESDEESLAESLADEPPEPPAEPSRTWTLCFDSIEAGLAVAPDLLRECFTQLSADERVAQAPPHVHEKGDTLLTRAARVGHVACLRTLLDLGAPVNQPTRRGGTALVIAAQEGWAEAVALLLERGAEIEAGSQVHSLEAAARNGHLGVARMLLDRGADPSRHRCLEFAADSDRPEIVRLVARAGGRALVSAQGGAAALRAAKFDKVESLRELVRLGANVLAPARVRDGRWRTPLEMAGKDTRAAALFRDILRAGGLAAGATWLRNEAAKRRWPLVRLRLLCASERARLASGGVAAAAASAGDAALRWMLVHPEDDGPDAEGAEPAQQRLQLAGGCPFELFQRILMWL